MSVEKLKNVCSQVVSFRASLVAQTVKNLPAMWGLYPGLARAPGERVGNPLEYSCLENSMDRGAWGGYSPWACKESDTTEKLTLSLLQLRDGIGLLFIPSIIRLYNALI